MSNETKWTKGPWVVGQSAWDEFELCVDTGYGCEPTGMPNEICPIASSHHDGEWGAEDKANAHLIAAAPDGAALAELVMELCGNPKGLSEAQQDELYETALQFMKKARGETS